MASRNGRRVRSPAGRFLLVLGVLLMVAAGGALTLLQGLSAQYGGKLIRADLLNGVPAPEGGGGGTNYLVLGSDPVPPADTGTTDAPETTDGPETTAAPETTDAPEAGAGADEAAGGGSITLLHISDDGASAVMVAIPIDSHVEVPAGGTWPGGLTTLSAAKDLGGPNLVARAIYDLTQVPLDGALIVDFGGLPDMVDAVGGVNVCIPFDVRSFFTDATWAAGCHDLAAGEVGEFIGPRTLVPGGEVGRTIIRQKVIMAVLRKAATTDVLTSPTQLSALLSRSAEALTVDPRLDVRELAFTLKGIAPEKLRFTAVPVSGQVPLETGPATEIDLPAAEELFTAVRDDALDPWLEAHPLRLGADGPA